METNERDRSVLAHILTYCEDIEDAVIRFGKDKVIFARDKEYRNACALCILQN